MSLSKEIEPLSEYELQRQRNILEIQGQFGDLFDNIKQSVIELAKDPGSSKAAGKHNNARKRDRNSQQWQRVKMVSKQTSSSGDNYVRRSARKIYENKNPVKYNEQSDSEDDQNIKKIRKGSLRVKFPFFKNKENQLKDEEYYKSLGDSDFIDSDDEEQYNDGEPHLKRKRRISTVSTSRLAVSQVTQDMLENVTYSSSKKQYSSLGTTCHQCRQKTLDQKSYCRYKECRGVRGMFCGFCLGKRYGEDVAEVLQNPKWACPPCRGYCNCSICRRKRGKSPTGQLVQLAEANGFKSVRHFLNSMEGEDEPEEGLSSESENNGNEDDKSKDDKSKDDKSKDDKSKDKNEDNVSKSNSNIKVNGIEIQHSDIVVTDEQSKTGDLNDDGVNTNKN